MRWDKPDNSGFYKITAVDTGTTGKYSVILTNKSSSSEKTVFEGTENEADIKVKRNHLYEFKLKAFDANKNTSSEWTKINYFPASDDSDNVVEDASDGPGCLAGTDESGIGAWHRHENVLYLTKDYKFTYAKDAHMSDHNNHTKDETIILDLAGHTINADQFTFGGDSTYIITNSGRSLNLIMPLVRKMRISCLS
ncbi:MAG: hypothetical protein PUF16_02085 [Lachnospiraceae bacterium]|nr:hypothetical protein [Lachnospiraceae bacterium]